MTAGAMSAKPDGKTPFESKQQWIENIMASNLSNATKVFAFGVYRHAYGDKTDAFPGATRIREVTGLSPSHYSDYRRSLEGAGALSITKKRAGFYRQEHCLYELNLDWFPQPSGDAGEIPESTDERNGPVGQSSVPTGQSTVSLGTGTPSPGGSNTSTNHQEHIQEAKQGVNVAECDVKDDSPESSDPVPTPTSLGGVELQAPMGDSSGGLMAFLKKNDAPARTAKRTPASSAKKKYDPGPHGWIKHHPAMRFRDEYIEGLTLLAEEGFRPDLDRDEWIDAALIEAGYPAEFLEPW